MGCSLNRRYTHDRRIIKIIDNRALRKHTHYSARSRRSERVSFARYTRETAEFRVFKKKRGKKHRRIFSCHEAVFRRIDSIQLQESHIPRAATVGGGNWLVKKEEKKRKKKKSEVRSGGRILVEADHADDRPADAFLIVLVSRSFTQLWPRYAVIPPSLEKPRDRERKESCRRVVTRRQVQRRTQSTRVVISRMEVTLRRSSRSRLSLKRGTTGRPVTGYPRT